MKTASTHVLGSASGKILSMQWSDHKAFAREVGVDPESVDIDGEVTITMSVDVIRGHGKWYAYIGGRTVGTALESRGEAAAAIERALEQLAR